MRRMMRIRGTSRIRSRSTGTTEDLLRRRLVVLHQYGGAGLEHSGSPLGNRPQRILIQQTDRFARILEDKVSKKAAPKNVLYKKCNYIKKWKGWRPEWVCKKIGI